MTGVRYVGRAPDSDFSIEPKGVADTRYSAVRVDGPYATSATADVTNTLATSTYIDAQDALRAQKVDVDAADANYLPVSQINAANGVAPLDNNAYVPSGNLPTLQTLRKPIFIPATSIIISGDRNVSTTNPKEYQAATLSIPDPGYPYIPLFFVDIRGGSALGNPVNRAMGTGSFGQMSVLRSDDTKWAWGLASSHKPMAFQHVIPFADSTIDPISRTPINGSGSFSLFLGLWSGTTYTFNSVGLNFYCLVFPGF